MKAIAEMHHSIDRLDQELARISSQQGRPITCQGKGCFACCYEPVYASEAEVKHMLEGLASERLEVVKQFTRIAVEKIRPTGLFDIDMPPVMKWLAQDVACPFLLSGLCSVYEHRPAACRSHMAVCSPDLCRTNRLKQEYPMSPEHSMACGKIIVASHLEIGSSFIHDNILALLANILLSDPMETASREQIIFEVES